MGHLLNIIYTGNDGPITYTSKSKDSSNFFDDHFELGVFSPWKEDEIISQCILGQDSEDFVWAGFLNFIKHESFLTSVRLAGRLHSSGYQHSINRADFEDVKATPIPHHNAYQFGVTINYYYFDHNYEEVKNQITWAFLVQVRDYIAFSNLEQYLTHENETLRKVVKKLI